MRGESRLFNPVQDLAVEIEAEKSDEHVSKDRRCISEIEFVRLNQALKGGKMTLHQVSGLIRLIDLLRFCRNRGEDQDPPGPFQPALQCLAIDLPLIKQMIQRLVLFHCKIRIFEKIERQPICLPFSGMDQPFVVEEMIGEVDPRQISGAVAALGKNEWNLFLDQGLLVLVRDKTAIENKHDP
ncbi:hypothetical protein DSECCO2_193770 [anaerobic digester metagenome]